MTGVKTPVPDRTPRLDPGWAGVTLTLLTGGGYLLGYLEIAFFASALGVTARDLGLDVKDYAVLALLNVAAIALAVVAVRLRTLSDVHETPSTKAWVDAGRSPGQRRVRRVLTDLLGMACFVVLSTVGLVLGLGGLGTLAMVAVAILSLVGVQMLRHHREWAGVAGALVALALVGLVAISCHTADAYARQLRDDARAGRRDVRLPPLPLRAILQPEVGVAMQGTATTCAIRVSPDVLLGRRAVAVATVDRFTVRRCDVADVPFG